MTRPIYEPTPSRKDAELQFGVDQLFRRPAPTSGGGFPGFHGHKESNLVVVSGNQGRLDWDEWIIDDDTVFEAGTLSGSDLTDIKLLRPGWYGIHCWAHWALDPATGFGGIVLIYDDTDFTEPAYHAQGMTYPLNFASQPSMIYQEVRNFPADFTQDQTLTFVNRLQFEVIQNSTVNRTINEAYCNVVYFGPRLEPSPSS